MTTIVLNEKFVAFAKNVTPIEHQGEFALTAESEFSLATLREIAVANNVKIPGSLKKKTDITVFLFEELSKLKIVEKKMSKLEGVIEIVNTGVEAGKSDDEMIIEIIQSGVKFKEANALFTKAMEQAGHRISPKERTAKIVEILEEAEFNPETVADLEAMVKRICEGDEDEEAVADTSEKQAMAAIRKISRLDWISFSETPPSLAQRSYISTE